VVVRCGGQYIVCPHSLLVNLLTGECGIDTAKMKIPKDLDTVEPIPFAGGTGLEIWSTVSAHTGET